MNSKTIIVLLVVFMAVAAIPEAHAFTAGGGGNIPGAGKREYMVIEYAPTRDPDTVKGVLASHENQTYFLMTNIRVTLVSYITPERFNPATATLALNRSLSFTVKDWDVLASCFCNGQASKCLNDTECICERNTAGKNCETCKSLYNNKPYQIRQPCRACGCNNHASSCHYNTTKGFGVCDNCVDNTAGDKCEQCKVEYYRNSFVWKNHSKTCLRKFELLHVNANFLECRTFGIVLTAIPPLKGQCPCKVNVDGRTCDKCKDGYYNLTESNADGCMSCGCNAAGSMNVTCNSTGGCFCRPRFYGLKCQSIESGYFVPSVDSLTVQAEYGSLSPAQEKKLNHSMLTLSSGKDVLFVGVILGESNNVTNPTRLTLTIIIPKTAWYTLAMRYMTSSNWYLLKLTAELRSLFSSFSCDGGATSVTRNNPHVFLANASAAEEAVTFGNEVCLREGTYSAVLELQPGSSGGQANTTIVVDSLVVIPSVSRYSLFQHVPAEVQSNVTSYFRLASSLKQWSIQSNYGCKALSGYYGYLYGEGQGCTPCNCSLDGSHNSTCDKTTGQCPCKEHSVGRTCDKCPSDYYGLGSPHPQGCLHCQCSNKTNNCTTAVGWGEAESSSKLLTTSDNTNKDGWKVVNGNGLTVQSLWDWTAALAKTLSPSLTMGFIRTKVTQEMYFSVPPKYVSEGRFAYTYTMSFKLQQDDDSSPENSTKGDVILKGKGFNQPIVYRLPSPPGTTFTGYTVSYRSCIDHNESNGKCRKCNCNGNVDTSVTGNCNTTTGECSNCGYNTTGSNCEWCTSGFYGNALNRTCSSCQCNSTGTRAGQPCNRVTGQCACLSHVVGWSCDRCEQNAFNFSSGMGCSLCNCLIQGANKTQCDVGFGERRKGRGGRGEEEGERRKGRGGWGEEEGERRMGRGGWGEEDGERRRGEEDGERRMGRGGWGEEDGERRMGRGGRGEEEGERRKGRGGRGEEEGERRKGRGGRGEEEGERRKGRGGRGEEEGERRKGKRRILLSYPFLLSPQTSQASKLRRLVTTGACDCKTNVIGSKCNSCRSGFYGVRLSTPCQTCNCSTSYTYSSTVCDVDTGQCNCSISRGGGRYGGRQCDSCETHSIGQPDNCRPCKEPCYLNWYNLIKVESDKVLGLEKNVTAMLEAFGGSLVTVDSINATIQELNRNLTYADSVFKGAQYDTKAKQDQINRIKDTINDLHRRLNESDRIIKDAEQYLRITVDGFNGTVKVLQADQSTPVVDVSGSIVYSDWVSLTAMATDYRNRALKLNESGHQSYKNITNSYETIKLANETAALAARQIRDAMTRLDQVSAQRAEVERRLGPEFQSELRNNSALLDEIEGLSEEINKLLKSAIAIGDNATTSVREAETTVKNANTTAHQRRLEAEKALTDAYSAHTRANQSRADTLKAQTVAAQFKVNATAVLGDAQGALNNVTQGINLISKAINQSRDSQAIADKVIAMNMPVTLETMKSLTNEIKAILVDPALINKTYKGAAEGLQKAKEVEALSKKAITVAQKTLSEVQSIEKSVANAKTSRSETEQLQLQTDEKVNQINNITESIQTRFGNASLIGEETLRLINKTISTVDESLKCFNESKKTAEAAVVRAEKAYNMTKHSEQVNVTVSANITSISNHVNPLAAIAKANYTSIVKAYNDSVQLLKDVNEAE
ncbi:hypothetical protein QZH41_008153, partial [Actinostola sp. cb2023]